MLAAAPRDHINLSTEWLPHLSIRLTSNRPSLSVPLMRSIPVPPTVPATMLTAVLLYGQVQ